MGSKHELTSWSLYMYVYLNRRAIYCNALGIQDGYFGGEAFSKSVVLDYVVSLNHVNLACIVGVTEVNVGKPE